LSAGNEERREDRPLLIVEVGRIRLGFHPAHMGVVPSPSHAASKRTIERALFVLTHQTAGMGSYGLASTARLSSQ
jgi:hypothetical protein